MAKTNKEVLIPELGNEKFKIKGSLKNFKRLNRISQYFESFELEKAEEELVKLLGKDNDYIDVLDELDLEYEVPAVILRVSLTMAGASKEDIEKEVNNLKEENELSKEIDDLEKELDLED